MLQNGRCLAVYWYKAFLNVQDWCMGLTPLGVVLHLLTISVWFWPREGQCRRYFMPEVEADAVSSGPVGLEVERKLASADPSEQ